MLSAFLASKKGVSGNPYFKQYPLSASLWHGYFVGNCVCVLSYTISAIIIVIVASTAFEVAILILFLTTIFMGILSLLLGVILYLPCAFLGYNLYARKLAEEEIARSQLQILKEIEAKKSSEQESVS